MGFDVKEARENEPSPSASLHDLVLDHIEDRAADGRVAPEYTAELTLIRDELRRCADLIDRALP